MIGISGVRRFCTASGLALIAFGLLWTAGATPADAQDIGSMFGHNADRWELRAGILSYNTGAFTDKYADDVVINGEFLAPSPGFLAAIGSPRPYIGFDIATDSESVSFGYAGLNWDAYFTDRLFASFSLGGAIHNSDDVKMWSDTQPALGCRTLFHLGAAIGYDITPNTMVELYADHISNASLCDPNEGLESAGVRAGVRF